MCNSSDSDLKFEQTASADVTETKAPYFSNNLLNSLFLILQYLLTVWKFQQPMVTMPECGFSQ